jgi:DMSO/TMAO reductase YedYZ heme-binding membrane subunit
MLDFILRNLGVLIAPILFILIYFFSKHIHKNQYKYELGSFLLANLVILIQPRFFNIQIPFLNALITSGHLSLAIFLLVMFAGVLKKNSKPKKALSMVRGELAVIGFIFLLPHAFARLALALSGYNMSGLFAFIILIPLVITTFMIVRKKMNPKHWKNLHKLSYLAYFLIYIHMAFTISANPNFRYIRFDSYALLYHLILIIYIGFRLFNVTIPKIKKNQMIKPS